MTPSEIGSEWPIRGVAGRNEQDVAHAGIFQEDDQRRDAASPSYGLKHPSKHESCAQQRRFGYVAGRGTSPVREKTVSDRAENPRRPPSPDASRHAEKRTATAVNGILGHSLRPAAGKILPSRGVQPVCPDGADGLYAALDLGTNNCRLLIAAPTRPGHFRVIDAFSRIVRLGEGIGRTGRLGNDAMNRAIEALKICRSRLAQCNIRHQWLIATEACRLADNGAQFIRRVRQEAGLELEIVDQETEARLAVSGCGTLVGRKTEAIVLFDIGGGSSEIALIDMSRRRSPRLAEHIIAWTSLPVGVVTLAERFGGTVVTEDDFACMKQYVGRLLDDFSGRNKLDHLARSPNFHLIGTSGTMTTLAGVHLNLERYDRRRVDGLWLKSADVTRITQILLSWNMEQRVANPCIGADRADLVLAGCAILEAIRSVWPASRLRVADRGLREGILTELMSRSGAWRRRRVMALRHGRDSGGGNRNGNGNDGGRRISDQ